jgi:energy-coupling factor transporter ATP-binding protein EcfA2
MKIARAVIENFRHIERLELDFTDSLGRVRDLVLLVGPNTCGKTTVLDALAVAVGLPTGLPYARPGFTLSPGDVRRGALYARVTGHVRFTEEEIEATREAFRLAEEPWPVPSAPEVEVVWQYPDPRNQSAYGYTSCDPEPAWTLFQGRAKVARLLPTGRVNWDWFRRVGAVFTFDQQRTGLGKTVRRDLWNIIHGLIGGEEPAAAERSTADPRTILLSLAVQSHFPQIGGSGEDGFKLIQEKYAGVCAPRRIVGAIRNEADDFEILFSDGHYEYRYDGLSSGEQMLLLFLIRMVTEHIHQSLVLVDEVELHQHLVWQSRFLHLLQNLGEANQVIATTHSPYLRNMVPRRAVADLSGLGDEAKRREVV